jgi:hypothetical protein
VDDLQEINSMIEGGGAPVAKFVNPGDTHKGRLVDAEKRQQTDMEQKPLFWDDGNPRMQVVATIDTDTPDENGETLRRLFIKGEMLKAVREALKTSNSKLAVGGVLTVRYTGEGEQTRKGYNPPKLFKAKYEPPAPGGPVDLDDL